jgi:sugar/nucleoside kinase (ribokinase family)
MTETEAIVAGHICLDIIPDFQTKAGETMSDYVAPGRLTEVGEARLSTGGAVPNTGLNLHRLGISTHLMGKIGVDLFGQAILDIIRSHGDDLEKGMIVAPGETSSYTLVINPPGLDRAFLTCPGANQSFGLDDIRTALRSDTHSDSGSDLFTQARLFHLGYPPLLARTWLDGGNELASIFKLAKERGATTSLDTVMPDPQGPSGQVDWQNVLANALPWVDLFLPSIEELLFMLDRPHFEAVESEHGAAEMLMAIEPALIQNLAAQALNLGARIVLIKLGTRGLYLRTPHKFGDFGRGASPNRESWQSRELWAMPYASQRVESTVGAGDAAIAGFLAAWLRGCSPLDALDMAAAAGASCVEEAGAVRGVSTWEELQQRIADGWPRLQDERPDTRWAADMSHSGVWRGPADKTVES